jgi:hypothetical protein
MLLEYIPCHFQSLRVCVLVSFGRMKRLLQRTDGHKPLNPEPQALRDDILREAAYFRFGSVGVSCLLSERWKAGLGAFTGSVNLN